MPFYPGLEYVPNRSSMSLVKVEDSAPDLVST